MTFIGRDCNIQHLWRHKNGNVEGENQSFTGRNYDRTVFFWRKRSLPVCKCRYKETKCLKDIWNFWDFSHGAQTVMVNLRFFKEPFQKWLWRLQLPSYGPSYNKQAERNDHIFTHSVDVPRPNTAYREHVSCFVRFSMQRTLGFLFQNRFEKLHWKFLLHRNMLKRKGLHITI